MCLTHLGEPDPEPSARSDAGCRSGSQEERREREKQERERKEPPPHEARRSMQGGGGGPPPPSPEGVPGLRRKSHPSSVRFGGSR